MRLNGEGRAFHEARKGAPPPMSRGVLRETPRRVKSAIKNQNGTARSQRRGAGMYMSILNRHGYGSSPPRKGRCGAVNATLHVQARTFLRVASAISSPRPPSAAATGATCPGRAAPACWGGAAPGSPSGFLAPSAAAAGFLYLRRARGGQLAGRWGEEGASF